MDLTHSPQPTGSARFEEALDRYLRETVWELIQRRNRPRTVLSQTAVGAVADLEDCADLTYRQHIAALIEAQRRHAPTSSGNSS
jgi:hypothetical protein